HPPGVSLEVEEMALAQPLEVAPLKIPEILRTGVFRPRLLQQPVQPRELSFLPCLVRQVDPGKVQIAVRPLALLLSFNPLAFRLFLLAFRQAWQEAQL